MSTECGICGGDKFGPGPGNRLSRTGMSPVCLSCKSLERHRAARDVMLKLRERSASRWAESKMLRFNADPLVGRDWFGSVETIKDLAAFPVEGKSYDVVICSDVLQLVKEPSVFMQSLFSCLNADGLIFLGCPSPITRQTTLDWAFPDPSRHGAYRIFGRDLGDYLVATLPEANTMSVTARDPVTQDQDLFFLLTNGSVWVRELRMSGLDAELLNVPADV